jgi:hypothetical protein
MSMPNDLKVDLYSQCMTYVNQRIDTARMALNEAQESANAEEKSSAGDKYETGRAMAHLEREKALGQLNEGLKLKAALEKVSLETTSVEVRLGSIVFTSTTNFYLSISAGKLLTGGTSFIALAPASPLGALLIGRKRGDQFVFNNQTWVITDIR